MTKSNAGKRLSLPAYWNGIQTTLEGKVAALKKFLTHSATGFSAEGYFRGLLRDYLPQRYVVDTGFIVSATGERTDFIDIIIADTQHIPPLCREPSFSVFLAESVCAVIEVTTCASSDGATKFEEDISKLARARRIAKERQYFDYLIHKRGAKLRVEKMDFFRSFCPRAYLITCGKEWKQRETYQKNLVIALKSVKREHDETWINAVFSVAHGTLAFRQKTDFIDVGWRRRDALLYFILSLNDALSSYPTWRMKMRSYLPALPRQDVSPKLTISPKKK